MVHLQPNVSILALRLDVGGNVQQRFNIGLSFCGPSVCAISSISAISAVPSWESKASATDVGKDCRVEAQADPVCHELTVRGLGSSFLGSVGFSLSFSLSLRGASVGSVGALNG